MAYQFFHPLGKNYSVEPTTYEGHGVGKLDFSIGEGTEVYSMSDGIVKYNGTYSDGVTAICIETNCAAISPITIRYLHGDWDESLTVDTSVKRGQKLGTVSDKGSSGSYHLHVDISAIANGFSPVEGTLNEDEDKIKFKVNNKTYNVLSTVDKDKVESWRTTNGKAEIGYNWLIFAAEGATQE